MNYRPICDTWILARPKVKYYGAYPAGFLHRARQLLGVGPGDRVLHVCSGKVRDYPYAGVGPEDWTLDIREDLKPDIVADVNNGIPSDHLKPWDAILTDPPYTLEDSKQYGTENHFPKPTALLASCLRAVRPGGRVGFLHYQVPRPPREGAKFVACIGVWCGFTNNIRAYRVFERTAP